MTVRKILLAGHPILHTQTYKVTDFKEIPGIVEDLRDTLRDVRERKGLGRGIAAPQIGVSKEIAYIMDGDTELTLINAYIRDRSKETMKVWDSCFSYDLGFFVLVERSKSIEVWNHTLENESRLETFSGPLAELVQHELDHLNGDLSLFRAVQPVRIMMREEWERVGRPHIVP